MNKFLNFLLSRQVITVAVVIVVCLFLCTLSKFVVSKIFSIKNKNIDIKKHRTIVNLVSNLFRLFVLAIGLIIVLQTFGVDTASFVASLGVFSLVIGLALQDVLKDFISGAYLVFEGQYSIGDWVKIGDFKGEVLASNFRTTKLRAYTGEVKIISNRNISEIINFSMSKNTAIIDVAVAYESDLGKVREVLDNLCELFLGFNKEDINKYYEIMKKNSDILGSKEEFIQIIKGIRKSFEFKIKDIILLFKASKDGDSASAFHQKCDGKQFTITLVKTTKGKRFGGFTRIAWHQNSNYSSDRYAFVFSFDYKENYYIYHYSGENAIYGYSSYGPTFGGGNDFYISNGCKSNNDSYNNMSSYYHTCLKSPLSGEYNFMVEDYEVFQLDLNNYDPK